mmetsp:Transcript_78747/g.92056  ORF Transcript_78747/g.92056 Transcript_78747/m.92056 type:complete len:419 (-) Transcript_78747:261-1517(-)
MKAQRSNLLFNINYKCDFGFSLYVSGSIPALGLWDPSKAVQMNWIEGHNWFTEISVSSEETQEVSYKYFIASENNFNPAQVVWEKGSNRQVQIPFFSAHTTLKDIWEHREVKILLKDPLPADFKSRKDIYLCGDILNLLKVTAPIKMELKELPESQTVNDRGGFFWTASFLMHHSVSTFEYKYTLYDKTKQSFVKNRKVSRSFTKPEITAIFPVMNYSKRFTKDVKQALIVTERGYESSSDESLPESIPSEIYQSHEIKFDYFNFSDFIYDRISPQILLGASINNPEEVSILKSEGVNVIINLQIPDDIRRHNPNHADVVTSCKCKGIDYFNFPIDERNTEEVILKCNKASKILKDQLDESKVVYLHCTYGAVRSVHSLISYLCLFEKYDVTEAIQFVQSKRALAVPSMELAKGIIQA